MVSLLVFHGKTNGATRAIARVTPKGVKGEVSPCKRYLIYGVERQRIYKYSACLPLTEVVYCRIINKGVIDICYLCGSIINPQGLIV